MSFDKDMTYLQSLKFVTLGIIRSPLTVDELYELKEAATTVFYLVFAALFRIACLIALPITAPLFTLLIMQERRKAAKQTDFNSAKEQRAAFRINRDD